MMKKPFLAGVFIVFIFGFLIRIIFLSRGALTFGYDQARDAYHAQQILNGDFKILGPPASTTGLYHGVFYYYLLAPAYFFGKGSPVITAYFIAFLNAGVVFIAFYLVYLMTKKFFPALLAAFLFAVSFESVQYATWLSNPTIGIWCVPLMYLGLWMWLKEKKDWGIILAGLGLGLSIQSEIFLLYHAVPLVFWLWIGKKEVKKRQLIIFALVLGLTLSSLIISEIKFGFKSFSGIKELMLSNETNLAYAKSLGDYFVLYLNQIGRIFAFNSYPGNIGYGGGFVLLLGILGLLGIKKRAISPKTFLATWLFSHLTVATVGGTSTPFLMVGIGPAISLLLAIFISEWWTKGYKLASALIIFVLILANLSLIFKENPKGSTLFAIQKDMLLSKELALIDWTYKKAQEQPFSLNSLTSPLWINIVWTYLYKWYGLPKYGYLPTWHGRDQVGQLDSLEHTPKSTENYFLILEPMAGIPARYLDETISEENAKSSQIEEKYWGELRVQFRKKHE